MAIFKFNENDIFINTIESYPQYKFYVQSGNVFIDDMPHMSGANTDHITGVPKGLLSKQTLRLITELSFCMVR